MWAFGLKSAIKSVLRRILPTSARKCVAALESLVDYRFKKHRASPTDYVAEFEHRNIHRARRSILWHDDWGLATRATLSILQELGVIKDGQLVIDYGCGIGRITRALLEEYNLQRVLAVDRAVEMRRHALSYIPRDYFDEGKVQLLSDAELLRLEGTLSGKVDVLLFIEVFHHIPEPVLDNLIPDLLGMLAPGGRAFVLGNQVLDVDAQGNRAYCKVEDVLRRYFDIIRRDVWAEMVVDGRPWRFRYPRHSFLCTRRQAQPET